MKKIMKWVTTAGLMASATIFAGGAQAASVFKNGNAYDGWTVTAAPGISLIVDSATGNTLTLEKFATFKTPGEGLIITFTQTSENAATSIDFSNESITNDTGTGWNGFQFLLLNPNGSASFVQNGNSPFAPPLGYTASTFGTDTLSYSGTQGNLATSLWGTGVDGDLIINADPLGLGTTFNFKEIPSGTAPVPLPAALWQGMIGMLGIGVFAIAKKLKRQNV